MANPLLIKAGIAIVKNPKDTGNIIKKIIVIPVALLFVVSAISGKMMSCFAGEDIDNVPISNTAAYKVCEEIYEDYKIWLDVRMEEEEERLIEANTYEVSWPENRIVDGKLVEVTIYQDRCDIEVKKKDPNFISYAYIMAYISTQYDPSDNMMQKIDRDSILDYLKVVSPLVTVKTTIEDKTVYWLYNGLQTADEAAAVFADIEKQNIFMTSFELYLGYLGMDGLTIAAVDGLDLTDATYLIHNVGLAIPHYFQNDYRNVRYGSGTLPSTGCAPTSIAMVASYLSGKDVTPADVVGKIGNAYYEPGSGSSWSIFAGTAGLWGMSCSNLGLSLSKAQEALSAGQPVIASMKPGLFTSSGHFIVLRGIQGDKFLVNDPNKRNYEKYQTDLFDIKTVSSQAKNYWSFY
jgi:hypothetical protein